MIAGAVALAFLWIAVLAQFPSQRRVPVRRLIWYTMLLLCAIGTLDLPQVGRPLNHVLGLPNAADVTQHVLAIIAATLARYGTVSIFGSWGERGRPSTARLAAWPAAVIVAMVTLFAVSPALTHPIDAARYTDFPMQFAPNPAVLAYWLVFTAYLGTTFAVIARLALRYGLAAGCTRVGSGLVLIAGGMVAGLGYLAYGSAVVVARAAGFQGWFVTTAPVVIQALFGALVVLVAAGCVLPAAPHCPVIRRVVAVPVTPAPLPAVGRPVPGGPGHRAGSGPGLGRPSRSPRPADAPVPAGHRDPRRLPGPGPGRRPRDR